MEGTSEDIKNTSTYVTKFIITTRNESKLNIARLNHKVTKISNNKYEIYVNNNTGEREVYEYLVLNNDVITFEKLLPTLEDAFISLTGRNLN